MELAIVGVIAVLLFGKRLPEVGRSMGKGIVEFKKGLRDIQSEVDVSSNTQTRSVPRNAIDDYDEPTAPKFDPPAREPQPAKNEQA
jgi:sec-independent protein translocase protein TatA